MKTFDPPGINSEGRGNPNQGASSDYRQLCRVWYPTARRRAVLSLIPGLGQFRNGEMAKGSLFLFVTMSNFVLLAVLLAGEQFKGPLSALASTFHRSPNWSLTAPIAAHGVGPLLAIYALLVVSFVSYAIRDAYDSALEIQRTGRPLPRSRFSLPEATSGSYLAHLAMIVSFALIFVVFVAPVPVAKQVTQIELVNEKPKAAEKKSSPAPKHQTPKPIVHPKPVVQPKPIIHPKPVVHPRPVKVIEPPKPMPVAVAVPTKEPTPLTLAPVEQAAPPPAAPAPPAPAAGTGSGSGVGSGTGTGSGGGDAEVDMGPYMKELQRRIKAHWYPPKGPSDKRIKVSFKVFKDGHIGKVRLVSSSGVSMADDAALQALQDAQPFARLPEGVGDDVDINFTFDYRIFGGGR